MGESPICLLQQLAPMRQAPALSTESLVRRIIGATFWTEIRQRRTAVAAELFAGRIFGAAFRAAHQYPLRELTDLRMLDHRSQLRESTDVDIYPRRRSAALSSFTSIHEHDSRLTFRLLIPTQLPVRTTAIDQSVRLSQRTAAGAGAVQQV